MHFDRSQLLQCSPSSPYACKGARRVTAQEVGFALRLANLRVTGPRFLDTGCGRAELSMLRANRSWRFLLSSHLTHAHSLPNCFRPLDRFLPDTVLYPTITVYSGNCFGVRVYRTTKRNLAPLMRQDEYLTSGEDFWTGA